MCAYIVQVSITAATVATRGGILMPTHLVMHWSGSITLISIGGADIRKAKASQFSALRKAIIVPVDIIGKCYGIRHCGKQN